MYDGVMNPELTQLFLKSKVAGFYMTKNPNQLLYSQEFLSSSWTTTDCTLVSGAADPNSGTEAYTLTATGANATMLQSIALQNGTLNRVFSIYLKRKTGIGDIFITVDGATYVAKTITGSWVRYDTTLAASGAVTCGVKIATSGDEVYVAWAQLEDGETPTTYLTNLASRLSTTKITDADYPVNTTRGCAYLDGRFFVMTPNAEVYQSALDNVSSWDALEFIQSQNDGDRGVYLGKANNYLVAFKEFSTDFFYDAANPSGSILAPVQNAAFQIGCASEDSVKEIAATLVWLGHTKDGFGRGVFRLNGISPEKISTNQVDKILDSDDLSTVYSWSANVGSHLIYGLTLVSSSVTLVYDFSTQLWSFFTYLTSSGVTKTVTAISTSGTVTSTSHGYSDGDIVLLSSTNASFNGWHVATNVTTNTFDVQATGTAFSGSGNAVKHTESYFPVISSVRSNGRQYMQHATNGALYEFSQDVYTDPIGAIAARIRTPKLDSGVANPKFMSQAELIGDKISSTAVVRYTDDDFATYSSFRPVDLSATRSRIRRLGNYNRRSFEILHVKNALLRLEAIEVDE